MEKESGIMTNICQIFCVFVCQAASDEFNQHINMIELSTLALRELTYY
jgi:hypothetical protein